MTVKEYATQNGLSKQAVYKRISRAGYKMAQLTDPTTGELTEVGEEVLQSLYADSKPNVDSQPLDRVNRLTYDKVVKERDELAKKVKELTTAGEALSTQLTEAEERVKRAREQADQWHEMAVTLLERVPKLEASKPESEKPVTLRQALALWLGSKTPNKK